MQITLLIDCENIRYSLIWFLIILSTNFIDVYFCQKYVFSIVIKILKKISLVLTPFCIIIQFGCILDIMRDFLLHHEIKHSFKISRKNKFGKFHNFFLRFFLQQITSLSLSNLTFFAIDICTYLIVFES